MTGILLGLAIFAGIVFIVALQASRRSIRCVLCGKPGFPAIGGTVDRPICYRHRDVQ